MTKLMIAVLSIAAIVFLGTANAAETNYQDVVGSWKVDDQCRGGECPDVMTIISVDKWGNVTGAYVSLQGEVVPLVGRVTEKKGDIWLEVKTPFGLAKFEVAMCEGEMDGYYTVSTEHRKVTYKKIT